MQRQVSGITRLFVPKDDLIEHFARQDIITRSPFYLTFKKSWPRVDIRIFLG